MKCNLNINLVCLIVLMSILTQSSVLNSQDSLTRTVNTATLKTQYFQIKDAFNYGLVFNGLMLAGRYSMEKKIENSILLYQPEFCFGANYNKGLGILLGLTPIDIFWGYNMNKNKRLVLGAYFLTDYNWEIYPELQSGQMFWFTSYEIGPQVIITLPIIHREFKIILSNSIIGLTFRPKPATESYFYSLTFSDFVSNAHSNHELGSFNLFNHTNLEIELLNNLERRYSLSYEFEYFGYFKNPKLTYLVHSLNFKWKIGEL